MERWLMLFSLAMLGFFATGNAFAMKSDGWDIAPGGTSVQEMAGGTVTVENIRGSDWGGGVGGILYTLRSGTPSYTFENMRGDVVAKTNAADSITYQAQYQAFGERPQETGSTLDRQKANTKEEDPTGLLNEGFRYHDLETGEFITADPMGFVDGPNRYTYVVQNPWSKFDPEGLNWFTDAQQKVKTAVASAVVAGVEFAAGAVGGFVQANVPNLPEIRPANRAESLGLMAGNVAAMAQGVIELKAGSTMVDSGMLLTAGTDGAGAPAGVPMVIGGVAVAAHGAAVAANGMNHFGQNLRNFPSSPADDATKLNMDNKQAAQGTGVSPTARGRASETRVLNDMGESKNTGKIVTSEGTTIPDFQNETQISEIKDRAVVSDSAQLRAQKEAAAASGKEHVLVTGTETHVTPNAAEGSTVIKRDDLGPKPSTNP
jgi:RHS repeat-associated protein